MLWGSGVLLRGGAWIETSIRERLICGWRIHPVAVAYVSTLCFSAFSAGPELQLVAIVSVDQF